MKISKNYISENKYEIIITNEKGEQFKIHYGGADLYWSMTIYNESNNFIITMEDKTFYYELKMLFRIIEKYDNPFDGLFKNNKFEWLSEAYGLPEEANKLIIKKEDNAFYIKFIRNKDNFSPMNTCFISFCLNGSRNQRIANAFSMMFLHFQNYEIDNSLEKVLKLQLQ